MLQKGANSERSIFVLTLRVILAYTTYGVDISTQDEFECLSWKDSKFNCDENGRVIGQYPEELQLITKLMDNNGLPSIWIGIHRQRHIYSFYPDQRIMTEGNGPGNEENSCSFMDIRDSYVDNTACKSSKHAFVCQFQDCSKCKPKRKCRYFNGMCFVSSCEALDWYSARKDCTSQGGDLLVAGDQIVEVLNSIHSSNGETCHQYWIGATNIEWIQDNLEVFEHQEAAPWAEGEPSDMASQDCVVLDKASGSHGWRTTSCEGNHYYICNSSLLEGTTESIRISSAPDEMILSSDDKDTFQNEKDTWYTTLGMYDEHFSAVTSWEMMLTIAISSAFIVTLLCVLLCVSIRKCRHKREQS